MIVAQIGNKWKMNESVPEKVNCMQFDEYEKICVVPTPIRHFN
jgi:hypothetical protein